ncbi:transmembrane protein 17A [Phycodurus eques]|uniref:transmembrane protein 17A n=1 Tax=Phycodurus eques TaxID=693459 RepID=UPI002ACDECC8|nr:transmembrane protein 17A [Phycodurus eques]
MPVFYSPVGDNAYVGTSVLSEHVHRERRDLSPSHSVANEVACDVPLQMLIYFNVFYFPCWWLSSVCMLEVKFAHLPGYYQGLLIAGIVLITLGELLRLYLGYFGNLEENVPALSSFCVLTFLFQLPVLLFMLTDEDAVVLPLERAVHLLFVGTLLAQSLAAGLAVRRMSRKLTLLFHLGQPAQVRPRFGHAGLAAYRRAVAPARARATCR